MRPIRQTFTLVAASANAICLSQKPTTSAALTINGAAASSEMNTAIRPSAARTVAVLDAYRRVSIASDADDSGRTFVLVGTDPAGTLFSESLAGPNTGAVSTLNSFSKILSVSVDAATAGNITVGTNNQADTPWMPVSTFQTPFALGLQVEFSTGANLTWQWQVSRSDPYDNTRASDKWPTNEGSAFTASGVQDVTGGPFAMVRGHISNYVGGSVNYTVIQAPASN